MKSDVNTHVQAFGKKIRASLLVFYFIPICILFLVLSLYFYQSSQQEFSNESSRRLNNLSELLAEKIKGFEIESIKVLNEESKTFINVKKRLESWRLKYGFEQISILDLNGIELIGVGEGSYRGQVYGDLAIYEMRFQKAALGEIKETPIFQNEQGVYEKSIFVPIKEKSTFPVQAVLVFKSSEAFFQVLERFKNVLAYACMAFLLMLVWMSVMLSRRIVNPLETLVRSMRELKAGHYQWPVHVKVENEIGYVASGIENMRQNIRSQSQEMAMMLKGVAHEVRNPLGGIELSLGLIQESSQDVRIKKWSDRIQVEVNHLKKLVQSFLEYADGPVLKLEALDLPIFFEDLKLHFGNSLKEKQVDWELSIENAEKHLLDPHLMRRVFLNVIQNALDAIKKRKGRIKIRVWEAEKHLLISVRDDGDGIAPKDLKQVFVPFFTQKSKGMGLGLSFVDRIVKLHKGKISVESVEGEGTVFTIKFPIKSGTK